MNWVDPTVAVVLLLGGLIGFKNGVLKQAGRLLVLLGSVYLSLYWHRPARSWLTARLADVDPIFLGPLTYAATFVAIFVCLWVLTLIIHQLTKNRSPRPVERFLGGVVSLFSSAIWVGLILLALAHIPVESVTSEVAASRTGLPFIRGMRGLVWTLPEDQKTPAADWIDQAEERLRNSRSGAPGAQVWVA